MKSILIGAALAVALAGCASAPNSDAPPQGANANSVYDDPTYPRPGVHIGIGAGSWGGRSGGGLGIGLGF